MIFHYYPDGDLYKYFKNTWKLKMPEKLVLYIAKQLLEALEKIHEKNILHRDLKPENILIVEETFEVVISDFGFAVRMDDPELLKFNRVGTLEFYPFEMLTHCDLGPNSFKGQRDHSHIVYD